MRLNSLIRSSCICLWEKLWFVVDFFPRYLLWLLEINWATLLTLLSLLSYLLGLFYLEKSCDLLTAWWLKIGVIKALPLVICMFGDSFIKPPCGSIYLLESKLLCTSLFLDDFNGICWAIYPGIEEGSLPTLVGDRGSYLGITPIWLLRFANCWPRSTAVVLCVGWPYRTSFSWLFYVNLFDFLSSLKFVLRICGMLCVLTLPFILLFVGLIGF